MTWRRVLVVGLPLIAVCALPLARRVAAQSTQKPLVRIAELEIDPAKLTAYKAALTEEIDTAIRVEPGVLALNAVAVKDHPEQIRLFEVYRDEAAYRAHLESTHFLKYKHETAGMVRSLKLIETEPVRLSSKR